VDPLLLAAWGLPGLFLSAFLAGSIVPLPSEAVLVALVGGGLSLAPLVAVASLGNLLGATTLYWLGARLAAGRGGAASAWLERRLARDPRAFERARARTRRWGAPLLLLSWLPVAGDLLVIAAGVAGVRWLPFLLFTGAGKTLRFCAVATAAAAAIATSN